MTIVLRIELTVRNFDSWKARSIVILLVDKNWVCVVTPILLPTDDPNYVMIDLEFDGLEAVSQNYETYWITWKGTDMTHLLLDLLPINGYMETSRTD
jgi:hypothetical protein